MDELGDLLRVVQAFVAPAIFVSAGGLLLLSLNARLVAVIARLRHYHDRRDEPWVQLQIRGLWRRARRLRNAAVAVLLGVGGSLAGCLLLGLALFAPGAARLAVAALAASIAALLVGIGFYLSEIAIVLAALRGEAEPESDRAGDRAPGLDP